MFSATQRQSYAQLSTNNESVSWEEIFPTSIFESSCVTKWIYLSIIQKFFGFFGLKRFSCN